MFDAPLPQGQRIGGDFEIIRELGAGGMGSVYLARQLSTDAVRALKVMRPRFQRDAEFVRRFTLEARASARIKSGHVIEVIAAGVDEALKMPWLAMEYLEGMTLNQALRRFGVPGAADARVMLDQLFHAIGGGHDARIVHRDLKPENVLLARASSPNQPFTVKVLDFGIAKWLSESEASATASLWTPLWGAPEQSSPGSSVGPQADVWALGLIVFWLLTGESFWHAERGLPAILKEIVVDPLPPASLRAAALGCTRPLPQAFDDWFARSVAREPSQRFSHAREAAGALFELNLPWAANAPEWRIDAALEFAATHAIGAPPSLDSTDEASAFRWTEAARDTGTGASALLSTESALPVSSTVPLPAPTVPGGPAPGPLLRSPRPGLGGRSRVLAALLLVGGAFATALVWRLGPASTRVALLPGRSTAVAEPPAGMRLVPPGSFLAGPWQNDVDGVLGAASRTAPVTLTAQRPLFIDTLEVDVSSYQACVRAGVCSKAEASDLALAALCNASHPDREHHPVNCVSRAQAQRYCAWLGKRLPSEAEWEHAARGSDGRLYPWGNDAPKSCEIAVVSPLCDRTPLPTRSAGSRVARSLSPFGVADLAGNVWEWVEDSWSREPAGDGPATLAPGAGDTGFGVLRGGSWDHGLERATATARLRALASETDVGFGFRCASSPTPSEAPRGAQPEP